VRRLKGLAGTPYARAFLLYLPQNAALLTCADTYGCVPPEVEVLIARDR
jgi:hypothetical protein